MALPQAVSTTSVLAGAFRLNQGLSIAVAYEDLGGKLALMISTMNALVSAVNIIQSAIVSANVSGVTFSAFSSTSAGLTSYSIASNFTAS